METLEAPEAMEVVEVIDVMEVAEAHTVNLEPSTESLDTQPCNELTESMETPSEDLCLDSIPDLPLLTLLQNLPYKDRMTCASTCRKFWKLAKTPRLWRRLRLDLTNETTLNEAINFARFHGRHIKSMNIDASPGHGSASLRLQSQITKLLQVLKARKTQLKKLKVRYFRLDRFFGFYTMKYRLSKSLVSFINKQTNLEHVDLTLNGLELPKALKILDALSTSSKETLETLDITDFIKGYQRTHQCLPLPVLVASFTNLTDLSLSWGSVSNALIERLAENCRGSCKLRDLSIRVRTNDSVAHRVDSVFWRRLRGARPELRVRMEFAGIHSYSIIQPILVPGIPLYELEIWSGYDMNDELRLPTLLQHVTDTYDTCLVSCSLEFDNTLVYLDRALLDLVRRCHKLKTLQVNAQVTAALLAAVCEARRKGDTGLQKFHVTCYGSNRCNYLEMHFIHDTYQTLFHEHNLDFRFNSDLLVEVDNGTEPEQPATSN